MAGEGENGDKLTRAERKRRFQEAQKAAPSGEVDAQDTKVNGLPRKLKKSSFLSLAESDPPRPRRCIIEYDGTAFNGFQAQEQRGTMRTVQETIEDAVARTTGETVRVKGCSRTDKGVHARGQVVVFESRCAVDDRAYRDALNTRLPEDVVCRSLSTLSADNEASFDPRANSIGKIYEYVIVSGPVRPALDRHRVWYMKKPLDVAKMRDAIALITAAPAAKDFSAFTPPKSSQLNADHGKGNVCTLSAVELSTEKLREANVEDGDKNDDTLCIRLRFHGDRFLYKMVRNLVGTLVDVGLGRLTPDDVAKLFETKDRSKAGQGAPPQGLTLLRVLYGNH